MNCPKYPDPSKVPILRTRTLAIQVPTPPLEGPRILRVGKIMKDDTCRTFCWSRDPLTWFCKWRDEKRGHPKKNKDQLQTIMGILGISPPPKATVPPRNNGSMVNKPWIRPLISGGVPKIPMIFSQRSPKRLVTKRGHLEEPSLNKNILGKTPGRKWSDQWWSDQWVISTNLLIHGVFLGVITHGS